MVVVKGSLRDATGGALLTPITICLTDYGLDPPSTVYLPVKVTVDPDLLGEFEVDLWANQLSSHPCVYRVDTGVGSSFLISVPGGEDGPLDLASLVITKPDLKEDTNILYRLATLEANGGGGGGGGATLTLGDGLTGASYNGSAPVTTNVSSAIARLNAPAFVNPTSNHPNPFDATGRLATTLWASNAGNITSGTLASARLPLDLAAVTATRLATPRTILGVPFDGTANVSLSLGAGLLEGGSPGSLFLDFGVVASVGDARFTNSREWSAATVTQAEAEAGTDTTRKAWTAQRVKQAIVAWWATLDSTIARLASPSLTGTPTAPTPASGATTNQIVNAEWASNASNLTQGSIPAARVPTLNQSTTGNASTATRLTTPRTILGVPFDGTADLGITLGSGLTVNGTAITLDPTDTRLTNSREWSAATVTQAEAEAGTDTTRKAWTAQRVKQAIVAWWATLDSTIARLASPGFTGTPTAPTPTAGDSTTKLATTEFSSNASNLTQGSIPAARVPTLNQSTTGNAATATKLATARTIAISGGATATATAFDGTANISLVVTAVDSTKLTGPPLTIEIGGTGSNSKVWVGSTGNEVIAGNKDFTGFTKLGDNVATKQKLLSGTTSNTEGGAVSITHELDASKIVSVTGVINVGGSYQLIESNNPTAPGQTLSISYNSTIFYCINVTGKSGNILSKPFKLFVSYTE